MKGKFTVDLTQSHGVADREHPIHKWKLWKAGNSLLTNPYLSVIH